MRKKEEKEEEKQAEEEEKKMQQEKRRRRRRRTSSRRARAGGQRERGLFALQLVNSTAFASRLATKQSGGVSSASGWARGSRGRR